MGNQLFITVRAGAGPPQTCDVRVRYEQTVADVRRAACSKLGVPVDKLEVRSERPSSRPV